jgi:hypothetical protein
MTTPLDLWELAVRAAESATFGRALLEQYGFTGRVAYERGYRNALAEVRAQHKALSTPEVA